MKNRGINACGAYIPALRMCRKSMAQAHSWSMPALRALARVSWKSHQNGARNPKAHRRKPVGMDTILNATIIAEPLGLFDYCGVSDGAAWAIVTTPEIARSLGKTDIVTIKALQLSLSAGCESATADWDGSYVRDTRFAAARAYEEAGIIQNTIY
ncbi:MAG: hypothetical protein OXC05_00980 [Halieaceae bacterium]|nr:hypothetical protein [Halieaceae bacterium]